MVNLEESKGNYRAGPSAIKKLEFCISQLRDGEWSPGFDWDTSPVIPSSDATTCRGGNVTMEEIIGALLHARDEIRECKTIKREMEAEVAL